MTLTLTVEPFEARTASQEERLAVGELLAAGFIHAFPEDPPLRPEQEAVSLTHLNSTERDAQFVIRDGTQMLAWGRLSWDTEQNLDNAHARLTVHPQARGRGLGTQVARELERVARREARTTVTFGTTDRNPDGEAFARHLGAQPALPMRVSRLDMTALDARQLRAWQTRPDGDEYRLHVWTVVPDEYLERVVDMMMVMNTAPKGDLDMDDWVITPQMVREWEAMIAEAGETRLLMAAEHLPSGRLDGYTEVFWDQHRAPLLYQGATAVRPEARGLGLGKWLKAAMLEHAAQECPGIHWVQTNNANVNAAMLGINVALGFQPWAQFTEWQLRLPELS